MENENKSILIDELQKPKVRPVGYVALILGIIFFSGFLANVDSFIKFFDYTVLTGKFGVLGTVKNVQGTGGTGARDGFMYVLTVWPSIILALGIINIIEGLDGLKAGQRLLNPVLRPLLGIPGWSSLALISGLTASTDAGAALTLDLVNNKLINDKELGIFSCFNFVASGFIGSSLTLAGTYVPFLQDVGIPLAFILVMGVVGKFIAGNLMRVYIKLADNKKN